MPSGTIYGSYAGTSPDWRLRIDYTYSQDISGNYSNITSNLYVEAGSGASSYNNTPNDAYYEIQGERTYATYSINGGGSYYLGSKSWTHNHNADGTASVKLTGYWNNKCGNTSYRPETLSISETITLNTIARESIPTLSASSCTMGGTIRVYSNSASGDFVHTIRYVFGGSDGYIGDFDAPTAHRWWDLTPRIDLATRIPSATYGTCTVYIKTYSDGSLSTQIGSERSVSFTLYVPSSVAPTISSFSTSVVNSNPTVNSWGIYLQGYSKMSYSISASGAYGSSVTGYTMSCSGVGSINGASGTSETITSSGTYTPVAYISDSRGRGNNYSGNSITIYPYSAPSISSCGATRCDSTGNSASGGTYLKCVYNSSYSSANGHNAVVIYASYKTSTGSYGSETQISTGAVIGGGTIATSSSYVVKFRIVDSLGNSSYKEVNVSSEARLVNVKSNGKGIAFGKYAESDMFECALPAKFSDTVSMPPLPVASGGTGNASGKAQTAYKADAVLGVYTSNGGNQPPSYTPSNTVKFNMMYGLNGAVDTGYCDWIMMDTYGGSDVPWTTAFGVLKTSTPHAFIGVGAKGGSSWSAWAELLTTYNTKAHVIAAGWSNGWYYHKWSTDWVEAWYYTTYNSVNINNAWGSVYESGQYTLPATGLTMTGFSRYSVALSGASAGVMGIEIGGWNAGGNPSFWFTRGSAGTGIAVHIVGHFFGY